MEIEMKIATFVLSLLSVTGQTPDGTPDAEDGMRRKKWKTTEPETTTSFTTTNADTTTTTTTTTPTESTTTTEQQTTTNEIVEETTRRIMTLPPNDSLDGNKDTKDNSQNREQELGIISQPTANDSDIEVEIDADIVHQGHQFGSLLNLETKGPILDDAPKAPEQQKVGKKKGGKKKKTKDEADEPVIEPGCNEKTLRERYN